MLSHHPMLPGAGRKSVQLFQSGGEQGSQFISERSFCLAVSGIRLSQVLYRWWRLHLVSPCRSHVQITLWCGGGCRDVWLHWDDNRQWWCETGWMMLSPGSAQESNVWLCVCSPAQFGGVGWQMILVVFFTLSDSVFSASGKTYSLTYTRVQVKDAAEIKFVAEKAESRARLTVKGNYASDDDFAWIISCFKPASILCFNAKEVKQHLDLSQK